MNKTGLRLIQVSLQWQRGGGDDCLIRCYYSFLDDLVSICLDNHHPLFICIPSSCLSAPSEDLQYGHSRGLAMLTSMYLWKDIFEILDCLPRILSILLYILDIVKLYSTAMPTSMSLSRHCWHCWLQYCRTLLYCWIFVKSPNIFLIFLLFFLPCSSSSLQKKEIFLLQLFSFFSFSRCGMPTLRGIVWHIFDQPHGSDLYCR